MHTRVNTVESKLVHVGAVDARVETVISICVQLKYQTDNNSHEAIW